MIRSHIIVLSTIVIAVLSLMTLETTTAYSSETPFIYTDDPQPDEEDNEYLDANGQPIKTFEYEEKYRQFAADMQKRASAPFGQANSEFGQEKAKINTIQSANQSQFKKLNQDEAFTGTGPLIEEPDEPEEPKPSAQKLKVEKSPEEMKRRVLVA